MLKQRPKRLLKQPKEVSERRVSIISFLTVEQERTVLQKQSKQEADQAIADFKAEKQAEYQKQTESVDTSDFSKDLNSKMDKEIAKMIKDSEGQVDPVVEMLLKFVGEVNTDVHINNQKIEA